MFIALPSFPAYLSKSACLFSLASLILAISACKNNTPSSKAENGPNARQGTRVAGLHQNNLSKDKSSLLTLASNSPIHWQPWSRHLFEHAKQEHKTVFALVGSGTNPNTHHILKQLNQSASTCALLNEQHVNVLIDSNCDPAMEYLAASLCRNSRTQVTSPLLIWFSYEGNPISWTASGSPNLNNASVLVSRMSKTVHRLWRDDSEYVLENSRADFNRRVKHPILSSDTEAEGISPSRAIRQASSLYDPTSNNIDKTGKVNTARYVNLLVKASTSGAMLDSHQLRYGGIARLSAQNNLIYGLTDPIDGGIFDGVQSISSALPIFTKSLKTQALSMETLYNLYQLTEDEIYLESADKIKTYTEQHLKQASGDYLEGIVYQENNPLDSHCTWTLEDLEKALTEEELRVCKFAFGIRGLGNVPLVDDRNRNYFRENTLTWKTTKPELAKKIGLSRNDLETLLESIMKKLGKIRTDRGLAFKETLCSSQSLALYTSALVAAYRATGDDSHLQDAKRVFSHITNNFIEESGLLHGTRFNGKLSSTAASAAAHALVCDAALNLHETTMDPSYLEMAQDTHTQMSNKLSGEGEQLLFEQDYSAFPTQYHVMHLFTIPSINNFSSWALAWSNSERLLKYQNNEHLRKQKTALEKSLFKMSGIPPIMLVDYLTCYSNLENTKVYYHGDTSSELHSTAIRRPCRIIAMSGNTHPDLSDKKVPDGSAAVIYRGKFIGITSQASELREWLK